MLKIKWHCVAFVINFQTTNWNVTFYTLLCNQFSLSYLMNHIECKWIVFNKKTMLIFMGNKLLCKNLNLKILWPHVKFFYSCKNQNLHKQTRYSQGMRLHTYKRAMVLHIFTDVIVIWLQHLTLNNILSTIPSFYEMKCNEKNKNKTSAHIYSKSIHFNGGTIYILISFLLLQIIKHCSTMFVTSRLHFDLNDEKIHLD